MSSWILRRFLPRDLHRNVLAWCLEIWRPHRKASVRSCTDNLSLSRWTLLSSVHCWPFFIGGWEVSFFFSKLDLTTPFWRNPSLEAISLCKCLADGEKNQDLNVDARWLLFQQGACHVKLYTMCFIWIGNAHLLQLLASCHCTSELAGTLVKSRWLLIWRFAPRSQFPSRAPCDRSKWSFPWVEIFFLSVLVAYSSELEFLQVTFGCCHNL